MASPDPGQEWQRLSEYYRQLSDEELQAVAAEGYSLTDVAREVLCGELRTRGLKTEIAFAPPAEAAEADEGPLGRFDPSTLPDLMIAQRLWSADEARRVLAVLHAAGVPAFLGAENAESVETLRAGFEKGVELKILEQDYQRVGWILSQLPREPHEGQEAEASNENAVVVCPSCRSPEIVFQRLEQDSPDGTHPDAQFNWRCDACGHEWKDDGVEQEG